MKELRFAANHLCSHLKLDL